MYFSRTRFFVAGISESGYAAALAILKRKSKCYVFDDAPTEAVNEKIDELVTLGAQVVEKSQVEEAIKKSDAVVLSPGVPIDSDISLIANKLHKNVIGELELGYRLCKSPLVAVTGTNGKTTTCAIIAEILKAAALPHFCAGNSGTPLCRFDGKFGEESIGVVEVSSFQLETVQSFAPHVACILNITPDHLERHYNMKNYVFLKSKIFENMRESEYAVLNYDDPTVMSVADSIRAEKIFFSADSQVSGAYFKDGKLFYKDKAIAKRGDLKLKGRHNELNVLAAVCAAKILGVKNEVIASVICDFSGVKHRQEIIAECGGITYVDDSKATNPDSALKAVETFPEKQILLLGGLDKGFGYEQFFEKINASGKIKAILLFGKSRKKLLLLAAESDAENIFMCESFSSAVFSACKMAEAGDTVLLSPACSSLDEFKNYAERGDSFAKIVNSVIKPETCARCEDEKSEEKEEDYVCGEESRE